MEFKTTSRGYILGSFRDRFGAECSVQESSYPDEPCIWLGVEVDSGGEAVPNGRMHISREGASEIIEILRHFVNEGALGEYGPGDFTVGSWVRGISKKNHSTYGRVIEAQPLKSITIQDQSTTGEAGQHICLWTDVAKLWEPAPAPEAGRTFFDHLDDDWSD